MRKDKLKEEQQVYKSFKAYKKKYFPNHYKEEERTMRLPKEWRR